MRLAEWRPGSKAGVAALLVLVGWGPGEPTPASARAVSGGALGAVPAVGVRAQPGAAGREGSGRPAGSGGPAASVAAPPAPLVPVLLVPGWSDTAAELTGLRARFLEAGWDSARVRALTFEDPVGSNRVHAREVALALAELRAATASPRIDVVAHSMGGLALRAHLVRQEVAEVDVRRAVFLATPHHGTWSALVAWGDGGDEMLPGSDFMVGLMAGAALPPAVDALTVRTPVDLHILPNESARLAGVPDVEVCCPTHAGLVDDPRVFDVIRAFLRDGEVQRPAGRLRP